MKKSLLLLLAVVCIAAVFAQAPQSIPYQAVARDSFGTPIPSQAMQARISIRNLTSTGTIVYRETDTFTTSSMGLFTINIGQGTVVSGTFSSIPWGTGAKFLQVELDPTGGTTYVDLGASQLLSVPYALFAGGAEGSGAAANGLHSDSGTIRLGGPLTDSVTFVTIPFNRALVFSPDTVEIEPGRHNGILVAHGDFDGDTALAIDLSANYLGISANKFVSISGANAPVNVVSEIYGDTVHFSEGAQVNVSVLHYGDSGDPLAFSGFAARPHETGLVVHSYSGSESKLTLDSSQVYVNTGSVAFQTDSFINFQLSALQVYAKHTAASNLNTIIQQSNESEVYNTSLFLQPTYASVAAHQISNASITSSLSAYIDTAQNEAGAEISAKNEDYQTYFNARPFKAITSIAYNPSSSPITYTYMDTTSFSVNLTSGRRLIFNDNELQITRANTPVFIVDTLGAITTTAVTTGFTNKTSAYTLTNSDHTVNCTSGTFALTLPSAAGIAGRIYVLNNSGSGTITINTTSSQTIDGNASGTLTLAQWHNYTVQSDGGNWIILSAK